jgi:regulator of sirC expression with transglutaminase-like and TPR domain
MSAKSRRYVYRAAYSKRADKWVVRKVLWSPTRFDTYSTRADAEEICDRLTRQAAQKVIQERKEASRDKICAGIAALNVEDLVNLRDWVVALMQLRG